jgi:GAF domain-containing protein
MTESALQIANSLAISLTGSDLDETLHRLTHAAVEALPRVDYCSITIRHHDGGLRTYAPTDTRLIELDEMQFATHEGPCYDGVTCNAFTVSGDIATDPRYPEYGRLASEAGIRSQAGMRLYEAKDSVGALNLYSTTVSALADVEFLALLFSQQASVAIKYAHQISNLNEAMLSRQLVGQAIGIIMERYRLSDERAFAFLSRVSQQRNVKLRVIAQELVDDAKRSDSYLPPQGTTG